MDQNNQNSNQTMNNNPEPTGGRTFTQDEVNRIVSNRLSEDRAKRAAELDEREKAVKARELAVIAAEKLSAAGLPKDLTAVLKYDDEESLEAAINQLSTLRGFTNGKKDPATGERKYVEHKLPEYTEQIEHDPLRAAFRLKHE